MKKICVYCGSASGILPAYAEAARAMAASLVQQELELVYGGGNVGLMGIIADEVMRLGGRVTGVIPQALMEKEVGHRGLSELHIVANMHERKAMMAQLSDGFIAMPGGMGTLEELFEVLTWAQLGFHDKPVGLLNVQAFYQPLLVFLQHACQQGFLKPAHLDLVIHDAGSQQLLDKMRSFQPLQIKKWVDRKDL